MIFKVAYKKGDRTSIKVGKDEKDEKGIWMGCSNKVYSWCKKMFKDGDEVDVEYTVKDGQHTASRVTRKGQDGGTKQTETKSKTSKGSYKQTYSGDYARRKHPEESKQIRALSILSSVCNAIQGLAGHVDPNNVGDIIATLFDRFDKKLP